jgi:hypothetical protein
MSKEIVYGIGGFCANCDDSHNHPLNNIVEENEIQDYINDELENKKTAVVEKLKNLGLTEEEISLIIT